MAAAQRRQTKPRTKQSPVRSPKAHRRSTRAEAAARDATPPALVEHGVRTLVAFANHTQRPWSTLWPGIVIWHIRGEPFTDRAADKLQQYTRAALLASTGGRFAPGSIGVVLPLTYRWTDDGVIVCGPEHNLDDYLCWLLLEAIRSGQVKRVKLCQESHCGRFFVAERSNGRYCSPSCQDAVENQPSPST